MKKLKLFTTAIVGASAILPMTYITSCSSSDALNYSDKDNWIYYKYYGDQAKYDLVYLVGTSVKEQTQENGVGLNKPQMKQLGLKNYYTVGNELVADCNVYVPLYRQMALNYSLKYVDKHEALLNDIRTKEPYIDLKAFLDYYFSYINKDGQRPFVLAGHSQGGASLQVVLDKYFINGGHKSYLKNMIAAYSIGFGVGKKWYDSLDKKLDDKEILHFATGADDFHCLLSWNSEGPDEAESKKGKNILLADEGDTTLVINPLNWKTDSTKASIDENKGVMVPESSSAISNDIEIPPGYKLSTLEKDKFDAQIDPVRGSVIVTGHSDKYMQIEGAYLWGGKSLHAWDGQGFYKNIWENIQVRVNAFLNSKK